MTSLWKRMPVQSKNGWKREIERVQCIYVCNRSDFLLINFGGHHRSTVPQFRPKLTLQIDLHYFDVQKRIHTQSKKQKGMCIVCSTFPYVALILVATTLAQIEVDLDQSWQSSTSFVSNLFIISLYLYLYLYYLYGVQRELYLWTQM